MAITYEVDPTTQKVTVTSKDDLLTASGVAGSLAAQAPLWNKDPNATLPIVFALFREMASRMENGQEYVDLWDAAMKAFVGNEFETMTWDD